MCFHRNGFSLTLLLRGLSVWHPLFSSPDFFLEQHGLKGVHSSTVIGARLMALSTSSDVPSWNVPLCYRCLGRVGSKEKGKASLFPSPCLAHPAHPQKSLAWIRTGKVCYMHLRDTDAHVQPVSWDSCQTVSDVPLIYHHKRLDHHPCPHKSWTQPGARNCFCAEEKSVLTSGQMFGKFLSPSLPVQEEAK